MSNPQRKKIITITFYIIVFMMLFYIVINSFFPDQSINYLGFKSYVVISPSMDPVISVNDLVFVVKVDEEELEVGDIISFYTYLPTNQIDEYGDTIYLKSVVTHYLGEIVISDDETIYKTHRAGVPENSYDDWNDIHGDPTEITYNDIIGKVSFTIPSIGVILKIFTNPIMVILIVVNISIIVTVIKVTKKALSKGDSS